MVALDRREVPCLATESLFSYHFSKHPEDEKDQRRIRDKSPLDPFAKGEDARRTRLLARCQLHRRFMPDGLEWLAGAKMRIRTRSLGLAQL